MLLKLEFHFRSPLISSSFRDLEDDDYDSGVFDPPAGGGLLIPHFDAARRMNPTTLCETHTGGSSHN